MMCIRAERTAVVFPDFRSALHIRTGKQVIVTTVPLLSNSGPVLAKHNFELALIGLVEQDAFLGFCFETCVVETLVGTVVPDGRTICAEQAHLQCACRSLLNAHLPPLSRHAGWI
uniref:Uncharacterized protein n=1 Tax=Ralstonia solanacearum CFBP2957 TaxID=859656 RepID=D8P2C9_RALSL|nr:protein of unknown function [Ralstonia solanacearum CFBP2957]